MRSRILFVSGHLDDARRLSRMLTSLSVTLERVESFQQARAKIQQNDYSVILTEAALPDGRWPDALSLARECQPEPIVIVTDPQADARFWAEALNLGVYDVLTQPFYEPEVCRIMSNACARVGQQVATAGASFGF